MGTWKVITFYAWVLVGIRDHSALRNKPVSRGWIFSQKSYELGGRLVWGICNFAVNLKPSSLLTPSQIQIFWLKIHPLNTGLVYYSDRYCKEIAAVWLWSVTSVVIVSQIKWLHRIKIKRQKLPEDTSCANRSLILWGSILRKKMRNRPQFLENNQVPTKS